MSGTRLSKALNPTNIIYIVSAASMTLFGREALKSTTKDSQTRPGYPYPLFTGANTPETKKEDQTDTQQEKAHGPQHKI